MKTAIIILALAALCAAQDSRSQYVTSQETASAAEKVTIQKPNGATKTIWFAYAKVYCTVATTATLSIDGTAATATARIGCEIDPQTADCRLSKPAVPVKP